MSEHVDFGELRSVLDGVRTPEQFERLIALMDAGVERVGRGVVEEQWLPYASQKLDQWPARVRRCRRELLRRLEQEGDVCWGRLVKTLDYEYSTLSARRVEELGEAKHLQNITHLDLSNTSVSWTDLNRLAQIAPFELESFSLRKSTSSGAKDSDIIPLFESPMLSKIKEISFPDWSRFGAASVKTMLERLPLGGLERLDVHGTGIGTSGLVKVLSCQGFTSLKALDVSGLDFTSKKVSRAFQEAEGLRGVRALNVSHTGIRLSTMRAASALPCWTGLEELDLSGNELGMEDVSWLCDVEEYPELRRLTLLAKGLDEEALERLFMASCFERVEALSLREASLTERSVSGEHGWGSLRELDLSCASLDGECWRALSRCTFWGGLKRLGLEGVVTPWLAARPSRGYYITRASYVEWVQELMGELLDAASLPEELEALVLRGCCVDEGLMRRFLEQECMETLELLDLSSYRDETGVSAREVRLLALSGKCPRLTTLVVDEDHALIGALVELAEGEGARSLRELHVRSNYEGGEVTMALRARLPGRVRVVDISA